MRRRATALKVIAAGLIAVGGAALTPGCASDRGGARAVANGIEYTIVVRNESKKAAQVTWAVAFRREGEVGFGRPLERRLGVIEPGATGRDGPTPIGMQASTSETWVQVLRVLVTIPSASWQEPAKMWWEVVGQVPREFVVTDGPGPDGFAVKLAAPGTKLEAVPRQYWSDEAPER